METDILLNLALPAWMITLLSALAAFLWPNVRAKIEASKPLQLALLFISIFAAVILGIAYPSPGSIVFSILFAAAPPVSLALLLNAKEAPQAFSSSPHTVSPQPVFTWITGLRLSSGRAHFLLFGGLAVLQIGSAILLSNTIKAQQLKDLLILGSVGLTFFSYFILTLKK